MSTQGAERRRQEVLSARKSAKSSATERLIDGLRDEDPIVREWSIEGLVARKDRAKATAALIERLSDERADLRWYAARALGKLRASTSEVREALGRALDDADLFVRCYAAWSIGQIRAVEFVPVLQGKLYERAITVGRKGNEETFAMGVAIMRIQTASPRVDEERQSTLFELETPVETTRPLTKLEMLQNDLFSTAEAVGIDRGGVELARTGRVVTKWEGLRSKVLKEQVRAERGPACQLCGFTFRRSDHGWYSESHHVESISLGGQDHPDNLLVVCANHHKQLHYAEVSWPKGKRRPSEVVIAGELVAIRWNDQG